MSVYNQEIPFENELIKYLENLGGSKQWQYLPEVKTTDQLWSNFKSILEINNQDKIPNQKLSNTEFSQIKNEITKLVTPYQSGQFLYGFNGTSQVLVNMDDGTDAYLTIFDQSQIGAGNTVYQLVNQIERNPVMTGKPSRRFDVTLLINGLPIIQIEEKASRHNADEALEQMHRYIAERQYSDIFSTLQILVAMTPNDIKYMSNATDEMFNKAFSFQWQNEKTNIPVTDWREFCNSMLSIPMAHRMATNYMILDGTKNRQMIKVMRPYQVYATRRVIEGIQTHQFGIEKKEIGYVWHTTGSGKTISSFKAAWLASQLPNVDKVVFLVDRVALTNQTVDEYQAYDPEKDDSNSGVVSDTANKFDLLRKLKSKGSGIIVTSTQKMDGLVRSGKVNDFAKNVVFIVDEAHRSTSGDMVQRIKKAFKRSAWIGYTGTPNFDENSGPTTEQVFGHVLHIYTIKNAIADKNVLGFKVDFQTTLSQDSLKDHYLPNYFKFRYPNWDQEKINNRIENMTDEDMDDAVVPSVYDNNDQHVKLVVDDILKHWENRSVSGRYNALLTTHVGGGKASYPMAMKYYDEFKKRNSELPAGKKLKVAVTFSQINNNSEGQLQNNKDLSRVIQDYNAMFDSNFDDTQISEYTQNVVARLNKTIDDGNYLDIVIVIDQLLTGFNAPELNTLYVDRTLKGAGLIQAYSRTNRVQNMTTKPFGRIVNYRWPVQTEKVMKEALTIYADEQSAYTQIELGKNDGTSILSKPFEELKEDLKKNITRISDLTNGIQSVPNSENAQEELVNELRQYNRTVAQIKQDDLYDSEHPEEFLNEMNLTLDDEVMITVKFPNDLETITAEDGEDGFKINELSLEMQHIKDISVNYDYLSELIAKVANQIHENDLEAAKQTKEELDHIIERISDAKYQQQVRDFADALMNNATTIKNYPVKDSDVEGLINDHVGEQETKYIAQFKRKWGIDQIPSNNKLDEIISRHVIGADDLDNQDERTEIIREGQDVYTEAAQDLEVQKLLKLKYRKNLREAIEKFADNMRRDY